MPPDTAYVRKECAVNIITEAEFNRQLTSPAAGYLLFGEEDYTKLHALERLRTAICPDPSSATFNDVRFSVADYSVPRILDALEPPPLLGDRKIISLTGLDLGAMREDQRNELADALAVLDDYDYNTLCILIPAGGIDYGRSIKKPSALLTRLSERLTPVYFPAIAPARLCGWVGKHFEHNGVAASSALCARVVEYCGCSMFVLANEIDKLCFYVLSQGRDTLTPEDIPLVAVPDLSFDTFDFANAIMAADRRRALNILMVMKQRKDEATMIMGSVSSTFCDMLTVRLLSEEGMSVAMISSETKIHDFKVRLLVEATSSVSSETLRRLVDMCRLSDADVKSSRGYEAIERLICAL